MTAGRRGCFKTRSVGPRPSEAVRDKERGRGHTTESIVESEPTKCRAAAAGRSQDGVLKQPLSTVLRYCNVFMRFSKG